MRCRRPLAPVRVRGVTRGVREDPVQRLPATADGEGKGDYPEQVEKASRHSFIVIRPGRRSSGEIGKNKKTRPGRVSRTRDEERFRKREAQAASVLNLGAPGKPMPPCCCPLEFEKPLGVGPWKPLGAPLKPAKFGLNPKKPWLLIGEPKDGALP